MYISKIEVIEICQSEKKKSSNLILLNERKKRFTKILMVYDIEINSESQS